MRVYSHDTVGYLTRLFISAKPLLFCPLLQQQKGKNELSFEPWHTRTHTHWRRGRGGHPVPSLSHVPPSFPLPMWRPSRALPSVRLLVRSLVRSAIVSSVLSTAPIPEAKREGEREGIGGRHRRRPRPGILISKFGSGAKSQSRQFFPGSQRRKGRRDDGGGRRARGSVQDCVVGRPTYEKGQSCGRGAGLGIYVMKLHMGKNTMVLTNDLGLRTRFSKNNVMSTSQQRPHSLSRFIM